MYITSLNTSGMAFTFFVENQGLENSIWLKDLDGLIEAEIYTTGGILNSFTIESDGSKTNVIDGFNNTNEAKTEMSNGFKSAFLSPFTCRMNRGKYSFNNINYTIDKFYLLPHAIHGIVFDASYTISNTTATENYASVTLQYHYNGFDLGFPFTYSIEHEWKLEAKGKLSVRTTISHSNSHSIPYAQGWHPYFTLGETIDNCTLFMDSNTLVVFDDTLIPTGEMANDERFENEQLLKDIFLDNCFALKNVEQPICKLQNNKLLLQILPDKSYPYLQVYTPPHRNSIAIENLSGVPDCFNNGIGLMNIEPHTNTIFATTYVLSKR